MDIQHKDLAEGRWYKLSLAEQLGNVGSEVSRAKNWHGRNEKFSENAFIRALELLDLTLADTRWRHRLKELTRVREVLGDLFMGGQEYKSTFEDLDRYFFHFAIAARSGK
mgnify:CR=1 FL=1